jgi:hypothetical protein
MSSGAEAGEFRIRDMRVQEQRLVSSRATTDEFMSRDR